VRILRMTGAKDPDEFIKRTARRSFRSSFSEREPYRLPA
jgi:hypothetical protein